MTAALAYAEPWKPQHGLPPWLRAEASGQAQGGPADASIGLVMVADKNGMPWFFNDRMREWQPRHVLAPDTPESLAAGVPGGQNTLDGMARLWYGKSTPLLIEQIASVPQNAAIVGPSPHTQYLDFDVLLVPGMPQPFPPPPGETTDPNAAMPGTVIPGIGTVGEKTPGFFPTGFFGAEPTNGKVVPVGGAPVTTAEAPAEEKFWTPGKIAVAAGVGALAVIGIAYFATRPTRRRNPRNRRNWVARNPRKNWVGRYDY